MRYRKKPVEIEAFQWDGRPPSYDRWPDWAMAAWKGETIHLAGGWLVVTTPFGDHRASRGDWITRGVAGELCPCKDEMFRQTYEAVAAHLEDDLEGRIRVAWDKLRAAYAERDAVDV